MKKVFIYQDFNLHYQTFGSGEKYLFAFHGFGKSSDDFAVFSSSFGKEYTLIAFDLFQHGEDQNKESLNEIKILKTSILIDLFKSFIEENNIHRFAILGYSLGGKIALSIAQHLPEKLDRIFLFAPDGIKFQYWYWFVSHSWLGRSIYRYIIHHPKFFHRTIALGVKIGVLNERMQKFLLMHTDTLEKRQLVYDVWMAFRDIQPSIKRVVKNINQRQIPTHLYFGKYDQVIKPAIGKRFVKKIPKTGELHIIETGHNLISEKVNEYLIKNPLA